MRSADDNLVPSDKDLEHLLRKAQKSAAKKEAYKKTTKQYYRSVANGIVREVFEDSSIDDHYLLLKCLMLRCAQEFSDLHHSSIICMRINSFGHCLAEVQSESLSNQDLSKVSKLLTAGKKVSAWDHSL